MAVHDREPASEPAPVRAAARRHVHTPAWNLLLLIPLVGTLIPSVYNRVGPTLFSIPFFYWYQMAWIAGSVAVTLIVYRMTRGER